MSDKHKEQFLQLGLNIAFYRKRKGLTQEKLAEIANLSRNHISQIEAVNMHTSMSLEMLFHLADVLEVPASKLLEMRE